MQRSVSVFDFFENVVGGGKQLRFVSVMMISYDKRRGDAKSK